MFWDNVAGVYDIFVNIINRKTHRRLKEIVSDLVEPDDTVLECACGTGLLSAVIAEKCRQFTVESYRQFFLDAGYPDVKVSLADGRIPCAVAVMRKASK